MIYDYLAFIGNEGVNSEFAKGIDVWSNSTQLFVLAAGNTDDMVNGKYKANCRKTARDLVKKLPVQLKVNCSVIDALEIEKLPDIKDLPTGSFMVHFQFRLAKPYLSRDDQILYPSDNPVRKEKIFKVPMIAPSTWKGHLRNAVRLGQNKADEDPVIIRLFGSSKKDDFEELVHGRIIIYPTFFYNIGEDVINPHDHQKKVGKRPIFFETVPEKELGKFTVLYVPHMALNGVEPESNEFNKQVKEDMTALFRGIADMMLLYGFSAKKTSGYGAAEDNVSFEYAGKVVVNPVKTLLHENISGNENLTPDSDLTGKSDIKKRKEITYEFKRLSDLSGLVRKIWYTGGKKNDFLS